MDVPKLSKFDGELHVLSDRCALGRSEARSEARSEEEWYIWFTPRGQSRTFVVDTVAEGLDIGNTIQIKGEMYRVDDIDIRKRNKQGKITMTRL